MVDYDEESFWVSLIPHTASLTTLGFKEEGDLVNLEVDIITRYLERLLNRPTGKAEKKSQLNWEFLKENGFL